MSRHEIYYQPKTFYIPCDCGSKEASWHRINNNTQSIYCCEECWKYRPENPEREIKPKLKD